MVGEQRARGRELLVALLCAALALPLLVLRTRFLREWGDEGYFVGAALRTLAGQVVYRDFQHNYPPGRALVLAGLFRVFGEDLSVARAAWASFHALAVGLAYLVARRLAPRPLALLAAVLVLLDPVFLNKSVELFLSAAVLLVLCRVVERRASDLGAGLALALCGWLRHDVAVFAALLFPVAKLLAPVRIGDAGGVFGAADELEARELPRGAWARLRGAWPFLVGVGLGLAPLVLWLGLAGALGIALRELALSGFVANQVLAKPFPMPWAGFDVSALREALDERLVFWVPPVTYAAGLVLGLARLRGRAAARTAERAPARRVAAAQLVVCAAFGTLLFAQVLPRSDFGHLDKALVPALVVQAGLLAAVVGARRAGADGREGLARPALRVLRGALLAGALALPAEVLWARGLGPTRSLPKLLLELADQVEVRAPGGSVWYGPNAAPRVQALFDELAPFAGREGETMVVYPAGATFNLLFHLPSPLRFDVLRPGELAGIELGESIPNNPRVLDAIEATLESAPPRVLWDMAEATNPEIQQRMLEFARRHDYRVLRAGPFTVFLRS